jgi:hypothetical protein
MIYTKLSNVHPYLRPQLGVTANIVLGSPKKRCDGIGICRIERASWVADEKGTEKCRQAKALLVAKGEKVVFYFIKHTLPPCITRKQFVDNLFKMEASVAIPDSLCMELYLPQNTCLLPGDYDVIDIGTHLGVAITFESVELIEQEN